ncbi:response regulator [Paracoccaceae bacterium Fryx2]|nr:response regulator [Paracoccaceae bacterium Fryx2]
MTPSRPAPADPHWQPPAGPVPPVPDPGTPRDAAALALLGHDLRAALSDVVGGLRLIAPEKLDAATRGHLDRVRAAGEVLARLLEEGLAEMLGDGGRTGTTQANLQIARFLRDAEVRWSGRAREKALDFRLTVAPDVPGVVTADRIGLERALSNLLANAINYTDRGAVCCTVSRAPDGRHLCFAVTDNGPGFSDAALAQLFRLGGRPTGTNRPGTGMGLHIAKEMADRMQGQLRVRNRPEGGAEVTLTLPLLPGCASPDEGPDGAPDIMAPLPDLSSVKILLAEDSVTNQILISRMLTRMGAEVVLAHDGIEALQWLERETFDLALIDIEMPHLSGIEVIRALRALSGPTGQMPVLAVTSYVLRANRAAILAAGADGVLEKPLVCPAILGQAIAQVIGRNLLPPQSRPPAATADHLPVMDEQRLDRLLEIAGHDTGRELVDRLNTDLRDVERALVRGFAGPDWDALRAQTHVLIALAGAVGALRLQHLSERLNAMAHQRDPTGLAALRHDLLALLDALIHFVARKRAKGPGDVP